MVVIPAHKKRFKYSAKHWLGKVSSAVFLGFSLCLGVSGLMLRYGFGDIAMYSIQGQFLMWMLSPLWLCLLGLCFLFPSGLAAWLYLGIANALVWGLVFLSPVLIP